MVPAAEFCTNCGAPLELDAASACRWCHARIHLERAPVFAPSYFDQVSLVPEDVDDCASVAPFLYLALSSLGLLGAQPEVREYLRGQPWLLEQVRALSTAVSAAGVRVRDAGLLKDSFDSNLAVYTPPEIWTFDLSFDAIAQLGLLEGLSGKIRAMTASNVRSLDEYSRRHAWKKHMKEAGGGPAAWRELRAHLPHRG